MEPEHRATPTTDDIADAPVAKFKKVQSQRAFEEVAQQIRKELMDGRVPVGSRLPSERAMAEQFGVSRNTLREALRALEHAGLLELRKGTTGGAFVSERSSNAISSNLMDMFHMGRIQPWQLSQARRWIESAVVREVCEHATEEDLATLQHNVEQTEEADRRNDAELRASLNINFHRLLGRICGNPIMIVMMDGVMDLMVEYVRRIGVKGASPNSYVLPSRKRFMKHLMNRDADAAIREINDLVDTQERFYLALDTASAGPVEAAVAPPPRRKPKA
ncbi:FadR/GntR family transcriptional regulator [Hydrogenophaga sp.]|uniref:FadR/GntR family transcriptional regulator n=1 Tax=Hydrogenophaga sp. TaxID=1904254 RepID=UPI00272495C3|nr:FadR/GntR family transcriptional regulator [Hydrogenophaga sp.]MDO9439063.1 FadR/GntR family transcriptional regulator [Hydrogenophaga sp.]